MARVKISFLTAITVAATATGAGVPNAGIIAHVYYQKGTVPMTISSIMQSSIVRLLISRPVCAVVLATLFLASAILMVSVISASAATTLYVSTTGSDSNSGTQAAPFRTLQKAANVAAPGTTVHVAPGTYTNSGIDPVVTTNISGTASARIIFISDTPWGAKLLSNNAYRVWMNNASFIDINGFDISSVDQTVAHLGIQNEGSNVRIIGNNVHDMFKNVTISTCDPNGGAGIVNSNYSAADNDVIGNVVHDLGNPTSAYIQANCWAFQGIYHSNLRGHVMNNIVYNIEAFGIHLHHAATQTVVSNNVSVNNGIGGIQVGVGDAPNLAIGDYYIVSNNIVTNNILFGIRGSNIGSNSIFTRNILIGNGSTYTNVPSNLVSNTFTFDPQFVNSGSRDYHLKSTSPAINTGSSSGAPSTDFDGNIRPQGGAYDIGAYEYGSTSPPPSDTTAPTIPTNLSGTAVSATQINLTWTASTDNVSVTGYKVYRNSTQVGTSATASYSDIGLTASTVYSYTVSVYDAAGNNSVQSGSVNVTTQAVAPQTPIGWWKFDETAGTTASDASGNNHPGTLINSPTWTTGKVGGAVSFNGTPNYVDFGDNLNLIGNDYSLSIWVKPNTLTDYMAFIDKLSSGGNYRIHGAADGSVAYGIRDTANVFNYISSVAGLLRVGTWTHIAVVHRNATNQGTLYINGVAVGTKTFTITRGSTTETLKSGYTANNSVYYKGAVDDMRIYNRVLSAAEVQSLYNIAPPPDTTAPTIPTNLSGTAVSAIQINLTWTASTDKVGVTGYKVYRNSTQVGTSATASYSDTGLAASTVYSYTVSAYDAAGNNSAQSASASFITLGFTARSIAIGSRVITTANLNVRQSASPSATKLGTESRGSLGTVVGGPTTASGHAWWQINYDNGINGWSIADYLGVVSVPSSPAVGMADPLPSIASTQPYTSLVHQVSNKSKN